MVKKVLSATEIKIRHAAKAIFLEKGFDWARTRDIAQKAWVNLALLNYYFWWKENLCREVILDILRDMTNHMMEIFNNEGTSFEEKITIFTREYIDLIAKNHKLIPFIAEWIKNNFNLVQQKIKKDETLFLNTVFFKQYLQKTKKTAEDFKIFYINMLSLIVFPIIGGPFLRTFLDYSEEQYRTFLFSRKEAIPTMILSFLE